MKLNPDCVRDILLEVENVCTPCEMYNFDPEQNTFSEYDSQTVLYHLAQCNLSGFLLKYSEDMAGCVSVMDLTPAGHQFIANIREKTIWNGVKGVAGKVGSTSLNALAQIASNVITELIKAQFNLSGTGS